MFEPTNSKMFTELRENYKERFHLTAPLQLKPVMPH